MLFIKVKKKTNSSNPKNALIPMEEIFNISIPVESEGICIKLGFWANSHTSTLSGKEKLTLA